MSSERRDRGILSPADRSYLRGETELASEQSERNTRARIRDRIYEGVLDFAVLVEHLSQHDRELIFGKRFDDLNGQAAFDALVAAVAFCYQATAETELAFEDVLREGINVAEAEHDRSATVALDVTFSALTPAQLRHKLERGESLSLTELAVAQQSDEIGAEELAEHRQDDESQAVDDGRIQAKVTDFG